MSRCNEDNQVIQPVQLCEKGAMPFFNNCLYLKNIPYTVRKKRQAFFVDIESQKAGKI
jgi:hypothetical protein